MRTASTSSATTPRWSSPSRSTTFPGAFMEVPESTVTILDESGYEHQPFMAA